MAVATFAWQGGARMFNHSQMSVSVAFLVLVDLAAAIVRAAC